MKFTSLNLSGSQYQTLQTCSLFHDLTEELLCAILGHWHVKKYDTDTVVLLEGHVGNEIFIILDGRVKICNNDSQGRETVIAYKGKGDVLGEMALIDGIPRSATVETVTSTTLLWTDREGFALCCKNAPKIHENLLKIVSTQLRMTNARLQVLQAPGAGCRVARLLVQLAEADPAGDVHVVPFKFSQAQIGAMAGLSRASVNHVLSVWKQLKYVSVDSRHRITIHNLAALKREAQ